MLFFFTPMLARLTLLVLGTLYPAYASFKAVKNKSSRDYVRWMMYWIIFAIFLFCEAFMDFFFYYLPFYHELKILLIVWLMAPFTRGSSVIYRRLVHPYLLQHEQEIDTMLDQVKSRSFGVIKDLGTRGLQTANRMLVDGIRNSMSLGDLSSVDGALRIFSGAGNPATVRRQQQLQLPHGPPPRALPALSEDEGEFEQQQRSGGGSRRNLFDYENDDSGETESPRNRTATTPSSSTLPRTVNRTKSLLTSQQNQQKVPSVSAQQPGSSRQHSVVTEKSITVEAHHQHGGEESSSHAPQTNGHREEHRNESRSKHVDDADDNADDTAAGDETDETWHTNDTSGASSTDAANISSEIEVISPSQSSTRQSLGSRPSISENRNRTSSKPSSAAANTNEVLPKIRTTNADNGGRITRRQAAAATATANMRSGRSSSSSGRM